MSKSKKPGQLDEIRSALLELSEREWSQYVDSLKDKRIDPGATDFRRLETFQGNYVVLDGVDTRGGLYDDRHRNDLIVHVDDGGQVWGITRDKRYKQLFRAAADLSLSLGWEPTEQFDIVAEGYDHEFAPGRWDTDLPKEWAPLVRVSAIRLPGRFAVFHRPDDGPHIPGLASAREKIEAFRQRKRTTTAIKEPKDLLEPLLESLKLSDYERFASLWMAPEHQFMERRFVQFRRAFTASSGKVFFDRYEPGEFKGADQVRVFVRRENDDGSEKVQPLVLVPKDDSWRLKSGMI